MKPKKATKSQRKKQSLQMSPEKPELGDKKKAELWYENTIAELKEQIEELKEVESRFSVNSAFVWSLKQFAQRVLNHLGPIDLDESVEIHELRLLAKDIDKAIDRNYIINTKIDPSVGVALRGGKSHGELTFPL